MEKGNEKLKQQELENITVFELKAALTKSKTKKSPGIDKVPNFWLNVLSSLQCVNKFTEWNYAKSEKKLLNVCAREHHTDLVNTMTQTSNISCDRYDKFTPGKKRSLSTRLERI